MQKRFPNLDLWVNVASFDSDFCCLLITFTNGLDPNQDQQKVNPDLDPNGLTLKASLKDIFSKS